MKRLLLNIAMCMVAICLSAQQNILVKYEASSLNTGRGVLISSDMDLLANPQKSLYFNKTSLYVDSCESTPEGAAKLREMQLKAWRVVQPDGTVTYDGRKLGLAPEKIEFLYVEKDAAADRMAVYDYKAGGMWRYEEPMSEMTWTIVEDSTKTILGMECMMAETDYHGRHWKAWFAPEVPVHDGPWKLHGLPGIILRAEGGDDFTFEAKEIGTTKMEIPSVYSVGDYEKGERKRILADHEHYINNFESIMNAQGIKLNADGSPANLEKFDRKHRALETDY